jgi:hypothetical protein
MNLLAGLLTSAAQHPCVVLAASRYRRYPDFFDVKENWPMLLLITAIVLWVLGGIIVYLRNNREAGGPVDDPQQLFRELAEAHGLDRSAQHLLQQLARAFQIEQPSEVFVTPQLFRPEKLPPSLAGEAHRVAALGQKLFG